MVREGFRSPKYGDRGVYFLCTGPDKDGPRPGPRVQAVIYDAEDRVIRRFEQIQGECIDEGYISFFGWPMDRPARYRLPLVDFAPDGTQTVLLPDFQAHMGREVFALVFAAWVGNFGRP